MLLRYCVVGFCLPILVLIGGKTAPAATYALTDLNPGGATASRAFGIDGSGDIVGDATVGGVTQPFIYTPAGGTQLVSLPPAWSPPAGYGGSIDVTSASFNAVAVNSTTGHLQAVGSISYVYTNGGALPQAAPALYDATMHTWTILTNLLNPLPPSPTSPPAPYNQNNSGQTASAVNATGQIAGGATSPGLVTSPFLYSGGTATNLSDLVGGSSGGIGTANGLDSAGDAAIRGRNSSGVQRAMLYNPALATAPIDLGALSSGTISDGHAVARNGNTVYVAGYSNGISAAGSGQQDAIFVYDIASQTTAIHGYGNAAVSGAFLYGINSQATAVGQNGATDGSAAVIVHLADAAYTSLYSSSLVYNLGEWTGFTSARAINEAGRIVGLGNVGGAQHAFALTPALPGDANLDGTVDVTDLGRLLTNYNRTGMAWADGDFDGNGSVDSQDLSKVLTNYNKTLGAGAGVNAVPEPSTLWLIAAASMAVAVLAVRNGRRLK